MKARVLHTKFWSDDFVAELTTAEKLVFLYLLTNEHVNIIHCYECTDRTILFDTGVNRDQLETAKQKLEAAGKVRFFQGWVQLMNADRFQQFNGEKNERAKMILEREMSASVFDWYKGKSDTPINTPIDTPIERVSIPSVSIINNHNHKEGGVGETTPDRLRPQDPVYLLGLPPEDMQEFGQKFNLSSQAITDKAEGIYDWYLAKPKQNKRDNWKSVLRNALRKDQDELRAKYGGYQQPGFRPTAQDWEWLKRGELDIFIGEAKVWAEQQIAEGKVQAII